MSRITIDNILNLCYVERPRVVDIEVVPRKMVEMIIDECEETIKKQERAIAYSDTDSYISSNAQAVRLSAMHLKEYAESLLKQFEEENNGI